LTRTRSGGNERRARENIGGGDGGSVVGEKRIVFAGDF